MKNSTLYPPRRRSLRVVAFLGFSLGASALLASCSSGDDAPSNLGNTADDLQLDPPSSTPTLDDFTGRWIGEAEDPLALDENGEPGVYRFPSGARQIRLDLFPGQQGTISFGDATPPPPPTRFDVGYPEGVNYMSDALFRATALPPVEGFVYGLDALFGPVTIPVESLFDDVPLEDGVARLFYRQNDVFAEWCSQQVPSGDLDSDGNHICLPTLEGANGGYGFGADAGDNPVCHISGGTSVDSPSVEVDCNQAYLCGIAPVPMCECYGDACHSYGEVSRGLYLRRVGDELVGVFSDGAFYSEGGHLTSLGTVRFRRAD